MELSYLSTAIAIISLLINLFLIWDRRKLKGYDIDKKLALNNIQIDETLSKYKDTKTRTTADITRRGLAGSPAAKELVQKVKDEEKRELDKLTIEKEHLLKLKTNKFPWSK